MKRSIQNMLATLVIVVSILAAICFGAAAQEGVYACRVWFLLCIAMTCVGIYKIKI